MSFIKWCCERGAKSHVAKKISGRGRRRSRDEKGNQGVGDSLFTKNILQLFSIYFFFQLLYFIFFFSILFLRTPFTHTHTRDPHPRPTTSTHYPDSSLSLPLLSGARAVMRKRKARERDFSLPITPCSRRARYAKTTGDESGADVHVCFHWRWQLRLSPSFCDAWEENCAKGILRTDPWSQGKLHLDIMNILVETPGHSFTYRATS